MRLVAQRGVQGCWPLSLIMRALRIIMRISGVALLVLTVATGMRNSKERLDDELDDGLTTQATEQADRLDNYFERPYSSRPSRFGGTHAYHL